MRRRCQIRSTNRMGGSPDEARFPYAPGEMAMAGSESSTGEKACSKARLSA